MLSTVACLALAALLVPVGHAPATGATASAAARAAMAGAHAVPPGAVHVAPLSQRGRWQVGTVVIPAGVALAREDEPRAFIYVAQRSGSRWTAAIEGTEGFSRLAAEARSALAGTPSADLLATTVTNSTGDGSAQLGLPWQPGTTWRLTGGPHHVHGGSSRPWSSLDFAGPRPGESALVTAARGGVVVRPCANMIQVRHADGWTTSYYHLRDITVRAGETIARGEALGYTSTRAGCGGSATGPHVHFSLLRSGSYVNIRGHAIGGWTVQDGSSSYKGCMARGTVRRCAPGGEISNDGSIGSTPTKERASRSAPYLA